MAQLACSTKYVCGTGTQISGSGSTTNFFLIRLQTSKIDWAPALAQNSAF